MGRDQRRQPPDPVRIESVERFVQQPQRRSRCGDPRQSRALELARRQQPDRHVRKMREAERAEVDGAAPEAERAPERQLAVERDMLVGEREVGPFDPSAFRPKQSRGEADQARLAASVRPRDLKRLAGAEREIETVEQQSPAAPESHRVEAQQRLHSAPSSSACMSSSEKPKWWPTSWITMWDTSWSRLTGVERHSARIGRLYNVIRS